MWHICFFDEDILPLSDLASSSKYIGTNVFPIIVLDTIQDMVA